MLRTYSFSDVPEKRGPPHRWTNDTVPEESVIDRGRNVNVLYGALLCHFPPVPAKDARTGIELVSRPSGCCSPAHCVRSKAMSTLVFVRMMQGRTIKY